MPLDLLTANDRPASYPASWYADTAVPPPPRAAAAGAIRADVCIIGAGFTGLSAALHLAQAGLDVVVLEAHRAGFGASGRNGGQVGTGQRRDQLWLERAVGREAAAALWQMGLEAVGLVRELIATHRIDADWRDGIISAAHKARLVGGMHAYAEHLQRAHGYEQITPLDRAQTAELTGSGGFFGGLLDLGGGHIHPLRFALGLARAAEASGARIFERSRALTIDTARAPVVRTRAASVRAEHVVIAANGYHGGLWGELAARVMPINNFIIATAPLPDGLAGRILPGDHAAHDTRFVVNYWRKSARGRLIFGGGESYSDRFPRDIAGLVRGKLRTIYPELADVEITHAWGGTLGITPSRMPFFRRQGAVIAAGGYSGHGVAMATLGGKLIAEAVQGRAERFDVLASVPVPRFPGGALARWPLLVAAMLWYSLRDRL